MLATIIVLILLFCLISGKYKNYVNCTLTPASSNGLGGFFKNFSLPKIPGPLSSPGPLNSPIASNE